MVLDNRTRSVGLKEASYCNPPVYICRRRVGAGKAPDPWRDRQCRELIELKKLFFSPPSKCRIDLFGPVSNRTILKRLHVARE